MSAHVIMLRRLKIALLGAVIIPALLILAGAWDERTQLLRVAEGDALATVTALREHALRAIGSDELLIRELDHRIRGMNPDAIRASSAALSAEIAIMQAGMPEVVALTVTDADDGFLTGSSEREWRGNLLLPHRDENDRETFIGSAYVGVLSGRQGFDISRRRRTSDELFGGAIHVSIAASYFSDFWSEVTAGQSDVIVGLVRLDDEVLARFPETGDTVPLTMGNTSRFVHRVEADPRGGVFRMTAAPNGIERIYAYARVETIRL